MDNLSNRFRFEQISFTKKSHRQNDVDVVLRKTANHDRGKNAAAEEFEIRVFECKVVE